MTKKQIILSLIPVYKRAIEYIDGLGDLDVAKNILEIFQLEFGVCNATKRLLKKDFYHYAWIKRHNIFPTESWGRYPIEANSTDEMVKLLQIRVDIMEKELKRKWWYNLKFW